MDNQGKLHKIAVESIRWLGFLASMSIAVIVLLFPSDWIGSHPGGMDIALIVGFVFVPTILSAVLSLARRYWLLTLPALCSVVWCFYFCLKEYPPRWLVVLILSTVVMLIVPFLSWVLRLKKRAEADLQ
jgi:O-antigen/teichoic acid export membrane protein